ncbi:PP2C family protein-serine/threonine phosphatase [Brachybacterium sp. AOP25-B2-12]|uniref:PP2C family protein-serine/threonine phosphatase n=1 Tax=Brachybacterium sp. AOP25-B2-12 TaxID=3457710 RepID=UPI00403342B0
MTFALRFAARSDVGLVRSNNQDSGYAGSHLVAVADGMGGHAGGDVASSIAIGRLAQLDSETPATEIVAALEEAILDANQAILRRAREEPQLAGLGTTVTALLRAEGKFALAHIGDSRAYLLRDGEATQITKDHSFVQRLLDEGRLTPEEAERHPQRSVLMRVLGDVDSEPELDLSLRPARVDDRWMLCSDGLSGLVSLETIERTLVKIEDPGECADALIELALKGGGPDNITCVIADVVDLDDLPKGVDAPSTSPEIVGSAARSRNRPTSASGPAAKAAALTRPERDVPFEDEDFSEDELPRRSRWPALVVAALIAAVIAGGLWAGYAWTQTQYYVAARDGRVVVYQGVSQDLGPIGLSHEVEQTDVLVSDLSSVTRGQVDETLPASDRAGADQIVDRLEAEAQQNQQARQAQEEQRQAEAAAAAAQSQQPTPPAATPTTQTPTDGPT